MEKKETPSEAFCRQNGIEPGSFEQSEMHAKLFGDKDGPGLYEKAQDHAAQAKAMNQMQTNPSLSEYVNIPRQGSDEDICQKTESHPNMEAYDHSLEQDRWHEIGGKGGRSDFIEMGDVEDLF